MIWPTPAEQRVWEQAGYIIRALKEDVCKSVRVLACLPWESWLTCCQSIQCRPTARLLDAGPPTLLWGNLWFRCWSWRCRSPSRSRTRCGSGNIQLWLWGRTPASSFISGDAALPPTVTTPHQIHNTTPCLMSLTQTCELMSWYWETLSK